MIVWAAGFWTNCSLWRDLWGKPKNRVTVVNTEADKAVNKDESLMRVEGGVKTINVL